MGEGKTNMFGKTYNTIGSTDSNFLIKTKGDLKVQWGGKFIDIIKNGKLASAGADILKVAASSDEISSNGIYLVPTEEGNEVWISIDGTKVNLAGEVGTTYVSFLAEQKEVTADQKYIALTNAGFYYETLEQAKASGIKAGIIFVQGEEKLYIARDGSLQEYKISAEEPEINTYFDEITISDLRIYKDQTVMMLTSPNLQMQINDRNALTIDSQIKSYLTLTMQSGTYIQSVNATNSNGYRLYIDSNGLSVLEVDSIIWRNGEEELARFTSNIIKYPIIYTEHSNIIVNTTPSTYIECKLQYQNNFLPGMSLYAFIDSEFQVELDYEEQDGYMVISANIGTMIALQPIRIEVSYLSASIQNQVIIEIPTGESSVSSQIAYSSDFEVIGWEVIDGAMSNSLIPIECKVIASDANTIQVELMQEDYREIFLKNSNNLLICQSNCPLIRIDGQVINVLDRSKTITEEITNESGVVETVEKPDETIHTRIGTVKETDFQQLKECPEEQEEINVGIYSDNFIGLNSKLYDTIFKKRCDFPKYDESIKIPEDFDDKKYDRAVPNIEWIKELIDRAVPSGTITMFNGASDIPVGWAVCDGTNGTPNLIGKFVKAVATADQIGDNPSDLSESNELVLTQEHLPKHSHPHKEHTHSLDGNISGTTGSSGDLTVSLDYSDYNWGIEGVTKTFVTSVAGEGVTTESGTVDGVSNIKTQGGNATGGSHTHSISLDTDGGVSLSSTKSQEEELVDSEWPNNPIKIEPRSYSLIFIMKL